MQYKITLDIRKIKPLFIKQGFLEASWVTLKESLSFKVYKSQIWDQNFGSMEFLKSHTDLKNPKKQTYKSALVALFPYYPNKDQLKSSLKIALYAQEKDYHIEVVKKLNSIVDELKKH